ncbi:Serine-rich coiled-coil domain-containing protein 2 [Varanus komodoensis]|nr:Serine-rich coiled-coil domain-containing protein 2 [Varanus komodoensis]
MEEKNRIRTSLVSRLPKYGTKPAGTILPTVPNGTALNLSGNTQRSDKKFSKHNGTINMSSFSINWRKSNKYQLGDQISSESSSSHNSSERLTDSEKCSQSERAGGKDVLRVGSNSAFSKIAKQSNMFVSPAEELNQTALSGLSSSAKFTKSSLLGRPSYSGPTAPKSHLNGICGNRSTGLQRNKGNSTATRSSSGESLAKSTDNDKSCETMVRSQSFSHSIQSSFLPPASLTRSHSFNRAVEIARPYQNQHLAIRTSQRSNLLSRSARQIDMPNANESLRYGFARSYIAFAPAVLKKPPLSNGSGDGPCLRFRTGRPSLLKPSNQHLGRKIPVDGNISKDTENCTVENSISTNTNGSIDANGTQNSERIEDGEVVCNNFVESGCKILMDGDVDEISISSLSSSEKNDLSEDFSDDFLDLEDPNRTIKIEEKEAYDQEVDCGNGILLEQLLSHKKSETPNCNSDEWLDIRDTVVDDKSESAKHSSGNNVISSDMDYRAGSSFELSPSDSSDGTYMWDEEGLEPIGSVHPCGSYDSSEMNSIAEETQFPQSRLIWHPLQDILNNLDSCDLEDDDLMLDVDLPEDVPCDNVDCENMNRYERPDRNIRQQKEGLWKRTPQRWNAQDHYHLGHTDHYPHSKNDLNRSCNYLDASPVGHLEGYGAPALYPPLRSLPANTVMLDEMTLRHMVQDCTAVKTQLLKMKRILHQNDENVSLHNIALSLPSSPELQEPEPIYKTDDLLSEITQLKEDLKKKDETIKQLEHRLSVRCNCSEDSKKPEVDSCTYADKYTQTSWKKSAGNAKECSNYRSIALISHASKVMLKILQARLQQYVDRELPEVQAGFRRGRETKEHLMRKVGLDESPVGIQIAGRNINNLRYADDTTLMAESEEELKSLLMQVKEESAKVDLKLNIKKTKIMASGPLSSWQIDGEEMEGGYSAPSFSPWQGSFQGIPRTVPPQRRQRPATTSLPHPADPSELSKVKGVQVILTQMIASSTSRAGWDLGPAERSYETVQPQVLQPSSLLPRFTDLAQGKLIKTSHTAALSENPSQDQQKTGGHEHQNAANGSCTNSLNVPSTLNTRLNVKKSEENSHSIKNVKVREKTKELTGRKSNMLQTHPSSCQSSAQHNTQEVQTKLVLKNNYSRTNEASPPKTSRATKPPKQNALVPPPVTVAAASPEGSPASKEPKLMPPGSPAQLQSASSQPDLNRKSQRTSKLRPPTISFRPKQTTNPSIMIPPEHQNSSPQTNHSRQLTQAKENMQNQDSSIRSGDSVASNRHSRLPKPKTY